jgi:hypothetical protein
MDTALRRQIVVTYFTLKSLVDTWGCLWIFGILQLKEITFHTVQSRVPNLPPFSIVPELVELSPGFGGVCIRHRTQPGVLKGLNS